MLDPADSGADTIAGSDLDRPDPCQPAALTDTTPITDSAADRIPLERAFDLDDFRLTDVARGPNGWVAVGTNQDEDVDGSRDYPAAWVSTDGLTWSGGPISGSSGYLGTVATDGSTWFAGGESFEADGIWAWFWRSPDGETWSLAGKFKLGDCPEGCPSIEQLAARSGRVVLSWVHALDRAQATVYWSENGGDWRQVDKQTLGLPIDAYMFYPNAVIVADGRFVLAGGSCEGCGTVWSSIDGRDWTIDLRVSPRPSEVDVATDGRRVILVARACPDICDTDHSTLTEVWVSADGRTGWTLSPQGLPIERAHVAFAAGVFIAVGETPDGVQIFASPDGVAWTQIPRRDLPLGSSCHVTSIAGSDDRVVVLGDGENPACSGIWVSRAP